jgi:hypothetical protein
MLLTDAQQLAALSAAMRPKQGQQVPGMHDRVDVL